METGEHDGIDWSGNASCILNEDEKDFYQNNGDHMGNSLLVTHDIEPTDIPLDASLTSWAGKYFGAASPAVSAIFDEATSDHDHRSHGSSGYNERLATTNAIDTSPATRKTSNTNSISSDATSVTTISIECLKHIHRFYQFKIKPKYASEIDQIATQYLLEYANETGEHGQLLATTINEQTLQCTMLVLFELSSARTSAADDSWMQQFLCYQPMLHVIDPSEQPTFTQLSQ